MAKLLYQRLHLYLLAGYGQRQRPYAYYNEGTLIPEKEEKHRNEGSYPSGHTVFFWTSALLLADINQSTEAMEALLARGYEFGQSRVIAGYHWQSDVEDHGVGSSDHFQESVILIMIHYRLNSHIICLDK